MAGTRRLETPKGWGRPDVLAASFSINLLSLALPIVILQVYDRVLPNAALDSFTIMAIGLCGVVLVEAALRIGRSYIMSWTGARFEHATAVEAFDRILGADIMQFEKDEPGSYLDRLQGLDSLRDYYSGQAALVLVDLPYVFLYIGLIWFIAGWLVVVPLLLLVVFTVFAIYVGSRLRNAMQRRSDTDERRYNFIIEILSGIHTIKSMAMEPVMLRRYERLQSQSAESVYDLSRISSISQGLGSSLGQVAMVAIVCAGAFSVVDGALTIGGLAASTMLAGRSLQPILRSMGLWTQFQAVRLARRRLDEVFELDSDGAAGARRADVASSGISGRIALEGVSFRYGEDEPPILDRVSLEISPGEAIGVTGDNGCGKSTLLNLMMGILRPTEGRVLVDGQDIAEIDPVALRSAIGYMPQRGGVFRGTLLDNLTMFRDGEAIERAIDLSRAIGLDDVITRLPRGLDTRLGEASVETLPEGVRQRIVIVRALVGLPPIILFDNASVALDQASDRRLATVFERYRGARTMVMVSHRPSLLRICDHTFRLAKGRLEPFELPDSVAPVRKQIESQAPIALGGGAAS
ncbi:MAG: ATP-binding cassette domain-containing protein [Inquilinus sp.]|nr:ATP-binding cassette domain-containing protein [Inquilinus sp.]